MSPNITKRKLKGFEIGRGRDKLIVKNVIKITYLNGEIEFNGMLYDHKGNFSFEPSFYATNKEDFYNHVKNTFSGLKTRKERYDAAVEAGRKNRTWVEGYGWTQRNKKSKEKAINRRDINKIREYLENTKKNLPLSSRLRNNAEKEKLKQIRISLNKSLKNTKELLDKYK